MNPGIDILERGHDIWEEKKNLLMKKPGSQYIWVVSWPYFWAHNIAEPSPDQLQES